jgi:hypothetical protein
MGDADPSNPSQFFQKLMMRLIETGQEIGSTLPEDYVPGPQTIQYPYFGFLPAYSGSVIPGGPAVTWVSPCFRNTTVSAAAINAQGISEITLNAQKPDTTGCTETYLIASLSSATIQTVTLVGDTKFEWNTTDFTSAEKWDINTKGIRFFRFVDDITGLIYDVQQTVTLFASYGTPSVDNKTAKANLDFLKDYAYHTYAKRSTPEVTLDESYIQNGDFLGVIRLDGLDPMLSWAMGSTTGHTTVALRDTDNTLHICESTVASAYWPTDYVQCTPYKTWLQQAKAASYLVTHAPLSPENAKAFNNSAAWSYFKTVEGYSYGFYNQFWGWIDTVSDNYPCLPNDNFGTYCLTYNHLEVITGLVEKVSWDLANQFFLQSLNLRIGTFNLTIAEIYQTAASKGITSAALYNMVELDTYQYNTTRNGKPAVGPSMVCCVFVCEVWKHGGLYASINNTVNCGEAANWDDYALHVFDDNYKKPAQCQAADPTTPTCQLEGDYSLTFNDYNTKTPVPHMGENCPSKNPYYQRPPGC